ncbi:hypothetical protein K503DRAFT_771705 [Rhizopogon vinicolor AM-OR11-026]|uniref:Uncharacterized protein n=1 Tax=Rhizopogon vinicolor AM-OR11-026 TaxID=1314800 RepID=A0A1B7MX67_9AGAM|nr:hypothetical protein K503DRAFT_771705 [Rhizopogon vinicolor AM-OR11-026]
MLGTSAHWKIYPIIYGVSCISVIALQTMGYRVSALSAWEKAIILTHYHRCI